MKRNLLIVLRTCTRVNMLNGENMGGRYHKVPKHELVNVCLSSIVDSINHCEGHDVKLIVLDDHSSNEAVQDFKTILAQCKSPTEFVSVTGGTGASYTCKKVYEIVDQQCTDLWYHAEDDYPHFPTAIQDMVDSVTKFEKMTGKMIAVNPHDDVYRYTAQVYPSFLLFGPYRHYRTVKHSTYTCLASRAVFDKYRNHFDDSAEWILRKDENETINQVWNKPDVMMFSPIPSLSLHVTLESLKDPYIDFQELWDSIPRLWETPAPDKFAVVSMYDESHADLAAHTWPNKVAYADKHGYRSYVKTGNWSIKPIHFEKITHMLDVMKSDPDLQWVWWLDNDAIITNPNIKLEDIVDDKFHVIITSDIACLNAGSFIVRNSTAGRNWLEFILKKGLEHYRDNRWPEQQPMSDFYISFQDIIKVVPQRTMNSYNYQIYRVDPTDLLGTNGQWEHGDFVLHMPAIPNSMRIDILKQVSQLSENCGIVTTY